MMFRRVIFSLLLVATVAQDSCYKYSSYYGQYYTEYCRGYCTGPLGSEDCLTYYTEAGGNISITIGASIGGAIGGLIVCCCCAFACAKSG